MKIMYEFEAEEIKQMIPYGLISYGMSERHLNTFTKRRKFAATFDDEEQKKCLELAKKARRWELQGLKGKVQMDLEELRLWQRLSQFCVNEFGGR